jgi:beta-glucosidase
MRYNTIDIQVLNDEKIALLPNSSKKKSPKWKRSLLVCMCFCMLLILFLIIAAATAVLVIWFVLERRFPDKGDELHWDWSKIDVNDIDFPSNFFWGTTSAAHTVEGYNINNQWFQFENEYIDGKSPILNGDKSGRAADEWNLYKEDIQIMKDQFHLNCYRFSIEWSKIQPSKDTFNKSAIEHYHALIDELLAKEIEPIITLHHFTDPIWFADMGSWEKEENIKYFVQFAIFIYKEFCNKVYRFITINEPNTFALMGYLEGRYPPGLKNPQTAGLVFKNMLEAHVRVFEAIKALPSGNNSHIGIVANFDQVDPANSSNVLDRVMSTMFNDLYVGSLLKFFTTGHFRFYVPYSADISYTNMRAINSNDFIGVKYYGNQYIKYSLKARHNYELVNRSKDIQTDIGLPIYPEGIYRAIQTASALNVSVFIVENGIANADNKWRELFIKRYIYAVSKAMKEGYDVIGYLYWSLVDNFYWQFGYQAKFGLCEVDFSTQKRTIRQQSLSFMNIVKRFSKKGFTNMNGYDDLDNIILSMEYNI